MVKAGTRIRVNIICSKHTLYKYNAAEECFYIDSLNPSAEDWNSCTFTASLSIQPSGSQLETLSHLHWPYTPSIAPTCTLVHLGSALVCCARAAQSCTESQQRQLEAFTAPVEEEQVAVCADEATDWPHNAALTAEKVCFTGTTQLPVQIQPHHSSRTETEECDSFSRLATLTCPQQKSNVNDVTVLLCCFVFKTELTWLEMLRSSELSCMYFP